MHSTLKSKDNLRKNWTVIKQKFMYGKNRAEVLIEQSWKVDTIKRKYLFATKKGYRKIIQYQ